MHLVALLRFAHAHPGLNIDVVIDTVDIGKSMMDDIVFLVPHKTVPTQDIQGKSSEVIDPFIFGKAAMRPVMHHIETDSGNDPTKQDTLQYRPKDRRGEKYQVDIDKNKTYHQDHRLQKKTVIPRLRLANLFEISTDPPL